MRVLITGITGFAGSHLAEHLLSLGEMEVHGVRRWRSPLENIEGIIDRIVLHDVELRDAHAVRKLVGEVRPRRIYHLAAQSFVPTSWNSPADTLVNNITSELNIFEAALKEEIEDVRIQCAGSSEEYGLVHPGETPIKETNPLRPLSPYAVSKVTQDYLAYQYHQSYGLFTVRTRGFNHTGPRRGDVFVTSNFAKQIAEIEAGKREPVMMVGNLDARRDFTDVRDTVRAYHLTLEKCSPGEVYNICSGKAWSIREMLDMLLALAQIDVEVRQDPARMRPSDVELLLGDNTRLREETGWEPTIPFEQTLRDLLDYWRARV
jgi:GDP-4-dehydro-6-deoxy-D-mannose reductase